MTQLHDSTRGGTTHVDSSNAQSFQTPSLGGRTTPSLICITSMAHPWCCSRLPGSLEQHHGCPIVVMQISDGVVHPPKLGVWKLCLFELSTCVVPPRVESCSCVIERARRTQRDGRDGAVDQDEIPQVADERDGTAPPGTRPGVRAVPRDAVWVRTVSYTHLTL